jgi:NAD(P)-dependent dehydrogenase (short-subunit alcohol dehydrogenase family)
VIGSSNGLLTFFVLRIEAPRRGAIARPRACRPVGRPDKPASVDAALAGYLASDESAWTNGASLVIDGGISVNYFYRNGTG